MTVSVSDDKHRYEDAQMQLETLPHCLTKYIYIYIYIYILVHLNKLGCRGKVSAIQLKL